MCLVSLKTNVSETAGQICLSDDLCAVRGIASDNVRCKMHQTSLQIKRTSRLKREKQDAFWRFKRKRKIANAKIHEDKRDLYCT